MVPNMGADDALIIENPCTPMAIAPVYAQLIQEAIAAYHTVFAAQVTEIRLLGSVARGEATPGDSDLDLLAIVRHAPTADKRAALDRHAATLGLANPLVSRVELDASRVEDLHPSRHFFVTSDSLAMAGRDTLTRRSQTVPREVLVHLVTPSRPHLLAAYREGVMHLDPLDGDQLRFYSWIIGKDLLKCLRGVILRRGAPYERNIAAIATQALAHFPDHAATITTLLRCYRTPTTDRAVLLQILDDAAQLPA
jgi:predicted nucleotidyltransferase